MTGGGACLHAQHAVGLALHALEPADEGVLVEHVPQCAVCQQLVRETQEVVWGLAAASEQVDPPPRLRARLLSEVAQTAQLPPEQRERPWRIGESDAMGGAGHPSLNGRSRAARGPFNKRPAFRAGAWGRSWQWSRGRRLVAVLATVVAVVGVGGVSVELVQRAHQQQQAAALAAPTPEVGRILGELDRAGARHAMLRSPDGQVVAAVAQFPDKRGVMPIRLAANPIDRTVYVLWGLGEGPAKAIGTFDVGAPAESMLTVSSPATPGHQFASYAISIENGRTMPASPGRIVASGQVES